MVSSSALNKLQMSAIKGLGVGAVGAVASAFLGNPFEGTRVAGVELPRFVAVGGTLEVSSVIADYTVPYLTKQAWLSGGNPFLSSIEAVIIQPAVLGGALVLLDNMIAKDIARDEKFGGTFLLGMGSAVGVGYLVDQMGINLISQLA